MNSSDLPEHVSENRSHWDDRAHEWVRGGEENWRSEEPFWGSWNIPESDLEMLPKDMSGLDVIELGCGTAYISGWMARRGAKVVAIDNSEKQLDTARRLSGEHGASIEFVHGSAETVPYPDGSFDFAISEYGAVTWCDPYKWIPEAYRLLREGGELRVLGSTPWTLVCSPLNGDNLVTRLERDYFGVHRVDWRDVEIDPGGIEFHLTISGWFRLFKEVGFEVVDYRELQAPSSLTEDRFAVPVEWAKRFPSEHVWKLRKRGEPGRGSVSGEHR